MLIINKAEGRRRWMNDNQEQRAEVGPLGHVERMEMRESALRA